MLDVSVKNVSFSYGHELVLGDINFNVKSGGFVCLLVQSGCGKSTLLRLLGGLEKPNKGEVLVGNKAVGGAGLDRGVIFQDYGLFPWMSTEKNITLALKLRAYLRAEDDLNKEGGKDKAIDLVVENLDLARDTVESFVKSPHMKYDTDPYVNSIIKMWNKMQDFRNLTYRTRFNSYL